LRFLQIGPRRADGFAPSENWFHIAPGREKLVRLQPLGNQEPATSPEVEIAALGSASIRP
jgi:beta-mannosidase